MGLLSRADAAKDILGKRMSCRARVAAKVPALPAFQAAAGGTRDPGVTVALAQATGLPLPPARKPAAHELPAADVGQYPAH
jgi:hypothetical protein